MSSIVVQIQSEQPLSADSAACGRGRIADAEGAEGWDARANLLGVTVLSRVDDQAVPSRHRVVVPRLQGPVSDDPFDGGHETEVEVGVALDVHRRIGASHGVYGGGLAVDGEFEALAGDAEAGGIRRQVVSQHVGQQWYARPAVLLGDARVLNIDGGHY